MTPPGTFPKIQFPAWPLRPCAFPDALDCWRPLFQIILVSIFVRHCMPLFLFLRLFTLNVKTCKHELVLCEIMSNLKPSEKDI